MSGLAPQLPLRVDAVDGPYGLIRSYVELVRQNFKMLLLTIPGERIMNPDYGVGLSQYLFEGNTSVQHAAINDAIASQTQRYMSYIQLNKIDFGVPESQPDLYPHTIAITIHFTIPPLGESTSIQIDF